MEDTNTGDKTVETPSTETINNTPSPIEAELNREKEKVVRSESEKAAFALQQNAKRVQELGLNPADILGIKPEIPKGTPLTVEEYEAREREKAARTAFEKAQEIPDEKERELTIKYLERIKPSGDPDEDLRFARLAVNSVRNSYLAEEVSRKTKPSSHASAPSAPANPTNDKKAELSKEDERIIASFGLTEEDIKKAGV